MAELVDQVAEGVIGVAEAVGDRLLGQAVEEDGAEGLVLALQGPGRLSEEALARGVVHNGWPECEVIVGDDPTGQRNSGREAGPGAKRCRGTGRPEKPGLPGREAAPSGVVSSVWGRWSVRAGREEPPHTEPHAEVGNTAPGRAAV